MPTRISNALIAVALVLLGSVSTAAVFLARAKHAPDNAVSCQVQDLTKRASEEEKTALFVFDREWLSSARVCSVGGFTILVPARQTEAHVIFVYRGRKPVLERTRDSSLVYSPMVPDNRFDQDTVNVWHPCEGRVTRLFYDTRTGTGNVSVGDLNFDGMPDTRLLSTPGGDIDQAYAWYQGAWHDIANTKLLIGERWQPARFIDGEWRVVQEGDAHAQPKSTTDCTPAA